MNKNELRIGNSVNEEVLGNCEVSDICEHVVMVKVNNGELDGTISKVTYTLNYCCINPIKLTEKWLLDFGFKKEDDCDWYNKSVGKRKELSYNTKTKCFVIGFKSYYSDNFSTIKYVHELQNLYFALTNKELNRVDGFFKS